MTARIQRISVMCPTCGDCFQTTEPKISRGRGRFCSRSCNAKTTSKKHGHTTKNGQSRTYNSWATMIQRCTNPANPKHARYGAVGITVCDDWSSFAKFLADMGERPDGTTLDRVDGALGYSKENCAWATPLQQSSHLKNSVVVSYQGQKYHLSGLARQLGINVATLKFRVKNTWPEERLADKPMLSRRGKRPSPFGGGALSLGT